MGDVVVLMTESPETCLVLSALREHNEKEGIYELGRGPVIDTAPLVP